MSTSGRQHPCRDLTEAEQALKRDQYTLWRQEIRNWLIAYPFTAKLVMRLKVVMVIDSRVLTACTDGTHVFVNANFAAECSSELRRFVLAHELYHVLLGHFMRQYGRNQYCWNLAVDAEANYRLMLDGLSLPEHAVFYPTQAGRNAETIYRWLLQHPRPEIDTPFDMHGEELFHPATLKGSQDGLVVDPDFTPRHVNAAMARRIIQHWQNAVLIESRKVAMGSIPAGMELIVRSAADTQIDWRTELHEHLLRQRGGSPNWSRLHRRSLVSGYYLPGRQTTTLTLMVAIDTSGSTRRYLPAFIAELKSILSSAEHVEIYLIECDAAVQRERIIRNVHDLQEITSHGSDTYVLRGGGGTDFRPAFERAQDVQPDCLIFMTDGYGEEPEKKFNFPIILLVTGKNNDSYLK